MTTPNGSGPDPSLGAVLFSCGICLATLSEEGEESVGRLWITECAHITCNKHLPGGAAPSYRRGVLPTAPCPHCVEEKGDDGEKELHEIRGLGDGEFDDSIPALWMACPPQALDGSTPEMEALRFQYLTLYRYACRASKYLRSAERGKVEMEAAYIEKMEQCRNLESEVMELRARESEIKGKQEQLEKWEARKPVIHHYLRVVKEMASDIEEMRSQLKWLGYEVPKRNYEYRPEQAEEELSRPFHKRKLDEYAEGDERLVREPMPPPVRSRISLAPYRGNMVAPREASPMPPASASPSLLDIGPPGEEGRQPWQTRQPVYGPRNQAPKPRPIEGRHDEQSPTNAWNLLNRRDSVATPVLQSQTRPTSVISPFFRAQDDKRQLYRDSDSSEVHRPRNHNTFRGRLTMPLVQQSTGQQNEPMLSRHTHVRKSSPQRPHQPSGESRLFPSNASRRRQGHF
ncbi:hypothetical protein K470DRAFT_51595 [Piedraia hortae CBS 480.64]|uniref:RING-type domain-containing protein n=1 Tax=Piedraia hortae CBS 480.64 TaxID=1314780 RepID=A0A6A7C9K5_9PEZI|nr:hypothetical protein K470DRAFT_51595 [Piedraia hortae CBS 480.64]